MGVNDVGIIGVGKDAYNSDLAGMINGRILPWVEDVEADGYPRQNTSIDHTCQITIIGIFSHTNNPYIIYAHGNQVIINGIQKAEPGSADSSIFMPKKDNTNITKIITRANNFTIGIRIGVQIFQVEIPLGYNSTYD